MSSSENNNKKIILESFDGETFEVEEAVALQCQTIKHMIEDDCASSVIPVPNVKGGILAKIIEYCKKHAADDSAADHKGWDAEFVKADLPTLFDLVLAANYLNVKSLLDLTCQAVADLIKDKSVEEVRQIFNIENDFNPEEEAEIRKENEWAFN